MSSEEASWKGKYEELFRAFVPLWNGALKWIAKNYGEEALDKYLDDQFMLDEYGCPTRYTLPVSKKDVEREGAAAAGKVLYKHLSFTGHDVKLEKAEYDQSILVDKKCASKSFLLEKKKDATYYCQHCIAVYRLPLWRELGLECEVEITGESSCIKRFKKIA